MERSAKKQNTWASVGAGLKKTGSVLWAGCKWVYKLRGLLLSIPVAVVAIYLAVKNGSALPASVGINLQANGEFATMIDRGVAIWVPLGITAGCIVFTCCSRRVIYPWLIGIFSLIIPILLQLTNSFIA